MAFKELNAAQRIIAVHTDFMRHKDFSILGGVTQIGVAKISDEVPTAGTDGCDVLYNEAFVMPMTRKQLRYLVGHENLHKSLHHCTEYTAWKTKYPEIFAQAIDYVVNDTLETMDPRFEFIERPTEVPPLIDPKFHNMSLPEVMRKLLDEQKGGGGGGGGSGRGKPIDVHMDGKPEAPELADDGKDLKTRINDAIAQGAIVQAQLRGTAPGSSSLDGFQEQHTDWRPPFRRFFQEMCEGDENSRFSPPNKRMLALDVVMPSHFSEATGEIIVACDTSGSMGPYYPVVFGEIANIAKLINPKLIRVLWWDTRVASEQVFTSKDYDKLPALMKPNGGGGTTVSCVAQYVKAKNYKPKATVMLSDGYIESQYEVVAGNVLWGIVGNPKFVPVRGKVLHINEV